MSDLLDDDIKLDMQRKVLGTYMNSLEFENDLHEKCEIFEELFTIRLHKAIARAILKLEGDNVPITELTIREFLRKHNIPSTIEEGDEWCRVAGELLITESFYNHCKNRLIKHKFAGGK